VLRILEERAFPVSKLRVYASERSLGRKLPFAGREVACEVLRPGCFDGLDLVIVDVDEPLSEEWAPQAVTSGARVIDKSSAFRMDPDVPLVIAEVNPDDMRSLPKGIASCPNCTTMIPVTALAPLHRAARIDRLVVSTYQSVSGAGQVGLHEQHSVYRHVCPRPGVRRPLGLGQRALSQTDVEGRSDRAAARRSRRSPD
jgi:aspartate-semialdehyde dehydrogenase